MVDFGHKFRIKSCILPRQNKIFSEWLKPHHPKNVKAAANFLPLDTVLLAHFS